MRNRARALGPASAPTRRARPGAWRRCRRRSRPRRRSGPSARPGAPPRASTSRPVSSATAAGRSPRRWPRPSAGRCPRACRRPRRRRAPTAGRGQRARSRRCRGWPRSPRPCRGWPTRDERASHRGPVTSDAASGRDGPGRSASSSCCSSTISLMPPSARASSSSSSPRLKAMPSAVPCTSMKRPDSVMTTFMSTSARRVLDVGQVEHRRAVDDADRDGGARLGERVGGDRPRPAPAG